MCSGASMTVEYTEKATSSTHAALHIVADISTDQNVTHVSREVYNFKRADWKEINTVLNYVDWSCLHEFTNINDAVSYFYDIVFAIMKDYVPVQRISHKRFPYWFDPELISLVKSKAKTHRDYINTNRDKTSAAYLKFCDLRKQVKALQKSKYLEYIDNIGEEIKTNSKRFWTFVKYLKGISSLPQVMTYGQREMKSYKDIANGFNDFFKSVFKQNASIIPPCDFRDVPLFRFKKIFSDEMLKEIISIKQSTSTGSDKFPATFLLKCAPRLCHPLTILFNLSIEMGEYPSIFKMNNVIPIYKQKDAKTEVESYRGISIQPIIAKIFERLVKKRLGPHMMNYISHNQHGFLPKKSCFTNLCCYSDYISKCIDDKYDVHAVYTDFQKAFDTVPFNLLLYKLQRRFGVCGTELKWFASYLQGRYQRVILNGIESAWVTVTSGVPQGSILGPLLFIMYIDDLCDKCENSESLLFADDGKIYKAIKYIADCLNLQLDLDRIFKWTIDWQLDLSLDKCATICFSNKTRNKITYSYKFGSHVIENVNTVKDLGVYFYANLNFKHHIEFIVSKASRMLGFAYRSTKCFKDNSVLLSLYKSYVRSRLEYCSSIWSPSQQYLILKIERVQKRLVRWMCYRDGLDYDTHGYLELCQNYNLQTLEMRRNVTDLCNLNKIYNNNLNSPYIVSQVLINVPNRQLRRNRLFSANCRINIRKNTFIPRVLSLANSVPAIDIFEQDKNAFKRKVLSVLK